MATEILAIGKTAEQSAGIAIADGEVAVFFLKGLNTSGVVDVQIQDDAGAWSTIGQLNNSKRAVKIDAAGTYRFSRKPGFNIGVCRG